MFCEESYSVFPTLISFITKLNSNQLNIKKKKINGDNFGKKYYKKKENTKETGKKPCEEKMYQSIVFCEKNLYLLVIAILNQLNILKIKLTRTIFGKNITKQKKTIWEKTL